MWARQSLEIDNPNDAGGLCWLVLLVEIRGIDEPGAAILISARTAVNMAEYVDLRFFCFHSFEEFHAAQMSSSWRDLVENAERRTMRDEDIKPRGD